MFARALPSSRTGPPTNLGAMSVQAVSSADLDRLRPHRDRPDHGAQLTSYWRGWGVPIPASADLEVGAPLARRHRLTGRSPIEERAQLLLDFHGIF